MIWPDLAVAALRNVELHPGLLHRMQSPVAQSPSMVVISACPQPRASASRRSGSPRRSRCTVQAPQSADTAAELGAGQRRVRRADTRAAASSGSPSNERSTPLTFKRIIFYRLTCAPPEQPSGGQSPCLSTAATFGRKPLSPRKSRGLGSRRLSNFYITRNCDTPQGAIDAAKGYAGAAAEVAAPFGEGKP